MAGRRTFPRQHRETRTRRPSLRHTTLNNGEGTQGFYAGRVSETDQGCDGQVLGLLSLVGNLGKHLVDNQVKNRGKISNFAKFIKLEFVL